MECARERRGKALRIRGVEISTDAQLRYRGFERELALVVSIEFRDRLGERFSLQDSMRPDVHARRRASSCGSMRVTDTRSGNTTAASLALSGGRTTHPIGRDCDAAFRHEHVHLRGARRRTVNAVPTARTFAPAAVTMKGRVLSCATSNRPSPRSSWTSRTRPRRTRTALLVLRSMTLPSSSTMREKPPTRVS